MYKRIELHNITRYKTGKALFYGNIITKNGHSVIAIDQILKFSDLQFQWEL